MHSVIIKISFTAPSPIFRCTHINIHQIRQKVHPKNRMHVCDWWRWWWREKNIIDERVAMILARTNFPNRFVFSPPEQLKIFSIQIFLSSWNCTHSLTYVKISPHIELDHALINFAFFAPSQESLLEKVLRIFLMSN